MSHIFKLIADKDTSQEGIVKLYEFKVDKHKTFIHKQKIKNGLLVIQTQYPDLDLGPFLKGSNAVFKRFIEVGLSDIEKSMQESNVESYAPDKKLDPDFWMEKLDSIMV